MGPRAPRAFAPPARQIVHKLYTILPAVNQILDQLRYLRRDGPNMYTIGRWHDTAGWTGQEGGTSWPYTRRHGHVAERLYAFVALGAAALMCSSMPALSADPIRIGLSLNLTGATAPGGAASSRRDWRSGATGQFKDMSREIVVWPPAQDRRSRLSLRPNGPMSRRDCGEVGKMKAPSGRVGGRVLTLPRLGDDLHVSEIVKMRAAIARRPSAVPTHLDGMGADAGDRARSGGLIAVPADPHHAIA